jgi:hypothetical protein
MVHLTDPCRLLGKAESIASRDLEGLDMGHSVGKGSEGFNAGGILDRAVLERQGVFIPHKANASIKDYMAVPAYKLDSGGRM